jgi:hypothetical protein
MLRSSCALSIAVLLSVASGSALADPLALLDRNGSYVAVEAYGPDILRITLAEGQSFCHGGLARFTWAYGVALERGRACVLLRHRRR